MMHSSSPRPSTSRLAAWLALAALALTAGCAHRGAGARALALARFTGPQAGPGAQAGCLRWQHAGSALTVRLMGPTLVADFVQRPGADPLGASESHYAVEVDGRPAQDVVLALGAGRRVLLAQAMGPGAHQVALRRRTEAAFGAADLCALEAPGGRLLPVPDAAPARRLVVVGDSISAGYGALCAAANERATPANEDGLRAYGALAAAAFGADYLGVAYSGAGVWRNGDGATANTVPRRWAAQRLASPAPRAGPDRVATRVVVNLGTNDLRRGDVDDAAFVAAYVAFLRQLQEAYPGAPMILALGPMLSDAYPVGLQALTHARALHRAVAQAGRAQGLTLWPLVFEEQDGSLGFGCDYHPNLATHARMAQALIAALAARPGW